MSAGHDRASNVLRPGSTFIEAVSGCWPRILSNPKTLLETGEVLMPLVAAGA